MFSYNLPDLWGEALVFVQQLWRAFFVIGIAPGIIGMVMLLRRNWQFGMMLLLMFFSHALFYIDYRAGDKELMFLPNYLIWALWIGIGLQWLLDWNRGEIAQDLINHWSINLVYIVIAAAVIFNFVWNWPLIDLSDDWSVRERGDNIMELVDPNAIIIGYWDTAPVIEYLQLVEGRRPDIQTINRFLIPPVYIESLISQNLPTRPIYIDRITGNLDQIYHSKKVGVLYRLTMKD
jgi:hypothetical protein